MKKVVFAGAGSRAWAHVKGIMNELPDDICTAGIFDRNPLRAEFTCSEGNALKVYDGILERAEEYTNIPKDNMSISTTHTHTGIPARVHRDEAYDAYLIRIAADCMTLSFQAMEEATLKFGKGSVCDISFNRVYDMADGRLQTAPEIGDGDVVSPHGPIDPEVSVLYAENKDGKPLGAMINFACHPDVVKGTKFSGDWPSILSYKMKDEYGRDFVSLFVNGTSGDINHVDVMGSTEYPPSEHYITMGSRVAEEAIKAISASEEIIGDDVSCKKECFSLPAGDWNMEKIEEAKHIVATVKPIEGLTLALGTGNKEQEDLLVAKSLLRAYDMRKESYPACISAAKVGDVYIYNLPCEMFVSFGLAIKEGSPSDKNILAELSHGMSGNYIPLKDMVYDSVYESRRTSFIYKAGSGEVITEKVIKMGKEL